jgi:hypothetical protein
VMHRKLARCHERSGRTCFQSQRISLGTQDGRYTLLPPHGGQNPPQRNTIGKGALQRPENRSDVRFSIKGMNFPTNP